MKNKKVIGMIISIVIIALMITITIKTKIETNDDTVALEEYPSGLIGDQVNDNFDPIDFGLEKNEVAPDFELRSLSGESVKLSDYRGKKVFLNFWATWCPGCKFEMPHMENYYRQYKDLDNIEVIAVNMTKDERRIEKVQEFVDSYELTFPVLLDHENRIKSLYKVLAYPTTYIINEEGIIIDRLSGSVEENEIKELIDNMK